jgi:arylsulfatase
MSDATAPTTGTRGHPPAVAARGIARGLLLVVVIASIVLLRPGDGPRAPIVQLELVESQMCRSTDRPQRLDCHLRTAADSTLVFRIDGTSVQDLAAEAILENGATEALAVEPSWWSGAAIDLSAYDHRRLQLRLFSTSGRAIRWHSAELRGHTERVPSPLAPLIERKQQRPNVLLYVVDTLRASRMSLYGYERDTTPRLREWAQRGVVFDHAYSNGADTRAGMPALLASGTPNELRGHMRMVRGRPSATLAELFKRRNYRTAAFQANITMSTSLGFARGFDLYKTVVAYDGEQRIKTAAPAVHEPALEWIQRDQRFPFFALIQTMDVHNPYDAPPPFRDRYFKGPTERPLPDVSGMAEDAAARILATYATLEPDRYDECVAYADAQIGEFLDQLETLGQLSNTVVIITADHGESLGAGARYPHGMSLDEEIVRIPLVVLLPWAVGHQRVDTVVSLVDVAPALADLLDLRAPRDYSGRSPFGPTTKHRPPFALGERNIGEQSVEWFLREGPWKVVLDENEPRLFHIPDDPMATVDVSARFPDITDYLARRVGAMDAGGGPQRPGKQGLGLSDAQMREVEEALRALGYE